MAYASKERKATIAAGLKEVMPKDWKYSLAIRHHSTFVLTIAKAPVDLVKLATANGYRAYDNHVQLGGHNVARHFEGTEVAEVFNKIQKVMYSADYHDRSDAMIDLHDTAYYVDMNLGRWDKGFEVQA